MEPACAHNRCKEEQGHGTGTGPQPVCGRTKSWNDDESLLDMAWHGTGVYRDQDGNSNRARLHQPSLAEPYYSLAMTRVATIDRPHQGTHTTVYIQNPVKPNLTALG